MTSSQANPAYSTNTESANTTNPITAPGGSSYDDDTSKPKDKLSFAERHKAPTTKDVETNKWVFGAQQVVSGPGDRRADNAETATGGTNDLGAGTTGGLVAAGGAATEMGGGQEQYRDETGGNVPIDDNLGGGDTTGYERSAQRDVAGGDAVSGPTGTGTGTESGYVEGRETGYEGQRPLGSTTAVYEGKTGYGDTGAGTEMGTETGAGTGSGYDNTTGTGTGVDDEDEDDGAGGKKKKNPLKKVVEAIKNI